jgi:GNAT superfamily N-acetyltransferase
MTDRSQARVPADRTVLVVRVAEDDWRDLKTVRLAALTEAPAAFGSTLTREQDYDEVRWRSWTRSSAVFLAFVDGTPVGIAAGRPGESSEEREIVSVWVDPTWRGRAIASHLLIAVLDWADADGSERVRLWMMRGNGAARRVYERLGFEATGRSKPLPRCPQLLEDEWVLVKRPDAAEDRGRPPSA